VTKPFEVWLCRPPSTTGTVAGHHYILSRAMAGAIHQARLHPACRVALRTMAGRELLEAQSDGHVVAWQWLNQAGAGV
jgi:hypothetical protein